MCHKHQVLPGAAAIKWCFGVSLSGAKQNEDRCVQQLFQQGPIDGIGAVSTDGTSRVNDFEYIHD